ncbi:MAG: YjgP/YjgQ family permease [Candidatus Omnitrophica bacterium]|nr:YjgP/YjgQ family permease [Candidatus Omnitrophota bacterium]
MSSGELLVARPAARSFPRLQSLHIRILNRYLLAELLPPLSMGLFLFSGAMVLVTIRSIMDVILLSGAPFGPIFKTLLCLFPPLLTVTLPIGCLVASLLVYGRLGEDREITAMRAAGVGTLSIMVPGLVLGAALTVVNFYWTAYITPRAVELMDRSRWEIVQQMTSVSWIKPGQFTPLRSDLACYFTGTTVGANTIHDITIFKSGRAEKGVTWFADNSADSAASNFTVSAPTATLRPIPSQGILQVILKDCITEDLSAERITRVLIENATITIDIGKNLAGMMGGFSEEQHGWWELRQRALKYAADYEYYRAGLGFPEDAPHAEVIAKAEEWIPKVEKDPSVSPLPGGVYDLQGPKRAIKAAQNNINASQLRLAYPSATFLFTMIGVALGILTGRGNRTVCILITAAVLLFYYSVQKIAEGISEGYALRIGFDPGFAVWTPNFLLLALGLLLSYLAARR